MNNSNVLFRKILKPVDKLLDHIPSYRLVLYTLFVLLTWSIAGSLAHKISFAWYDILLTAAVLLTVCLGSNYLFSKYLNIPKNNESDYVSALILTLILTPTHSFKELLFVAIAGVLAMASKYILAVKKWHVFNPAAFGAVVSGLAFNHYAIWWIGTNFMAPFVILGGLLILRKVKRYTMVAVFIAVALAAILAEAYLNQSSPHIAHLINLTFLSTPLLFFAFIMLTEPLTHPRHATNYFPYAILVGFLYGYTKLGISPEQALLIGNVFAYIIEPNRRIELKFVRKITEVAGIDSFVFSSKQGLKYRAGQYMEWTVHDNKPDLRGNRRYLTISSSPTEPDLMFTLRIPEKMSKFKQDIESLKKGDTVLASQLAGEFVLPKSEKQKLAFLAGGVGITPFRSMVKYATDFGQKRDINLLYSANTQEEFAFKDIFNEAKSYGINTVYTTERINAENIAELVPDYKERIFYVSGPYGFVQAMENNLLRLGLPLKQIKIDYFPGYS
jgi:ferredoxin-NADP reductase